MSLIENILDLNLSDLAKMLIAKNSSVLNETNVTSVIVALILLYNVDDWLKRDIDFDTNHSSSCPKYLDSLLLQFTTTKCVLYT